MCVVVSLVVGEVFREPSRLPVRTRLPSGVLAAPTPNIAIATSIPNPPRGSPSAQHGVCVCVFYGRLHGASTMLSPLTLTIVQSTVLNAVSNILAQLIDQRNNTVKSSRPPRHPDTTTNEKKSQTPFVLNTLALLQFITYGILIVPINFYWQRALEARYPGFPSRAEIAGVCRCSSRSCSLTSLCSLASLRSLFWSSATAGASSKDRDDDRLPSHKEKEKQAPRWTARARQSGLRSFVMKFIFDQTVASVMNIVLFVVLINFLKGESLARVWELVLEDFHPIMSARLKYRPTVSILMYTVIPVDRRVVFGSACGWSARLGCLAVGMEKSSRNMEVYWAQDGTK
ncbi:uncharacterized protein N7459_001764 [Penicillium hispanicum]|uniref:uncharacterized protein n=1 Tax=Penicillium hispanicum TaxID=1080232 RepID=UPI0025400768|nr:uncharacterized protein N7459_001764 [Penicillium hispanicum]KAJ5595556.1 hypothetical protein N7459_001764 [Penicillium hispanicum]